ncbi:hypothetical protein BDQ12DRAFT_675945 [Crucibulum laeve]|uniref:Uncharacterized protein n=1 Tax=Crucibulum laeve TaxID=68775 RepID=A0A5C3MC99_9AGAR|nr:hypothetical protein BDQ12DRAFT_675945 [Crucibulum laeve]
MYPPEPRLDTPPPQSAFRRPWSPDYDTYDAVLPQQQQQQQRRQASDVSVEALDLADYARTLRARQVEDPYPAFPSFGDVSHSNAHSLSANQPSYPPTSYPSHPSYPHPSYNSFTSSQAHLHPHASADSLHPPSLVSRGPTLSSQSHATHSSRGCVRRPFSLPPPASSSGHGSKSKKGKGPYIADPSLDIHSNLYTNDSEIDISQFPKWSRGWYAARPRASSNPVYDEEDIPPSQLNLNLPPSNPSKQLSPFDPGYIHPPYSPYSPSSPHAYPDPYAPPPSFDNSHLPWGADPPDYSSPQLDPSTKEERMRMLEREFGDTSPRHKGKGKSTADPNDQPIGSVDPQGNLITSGPKKRLILRILQFLLVIAAGAPAIYAALAIKPTPPAPPAGKPAAWVLYVASVLSFVGVVWVFVMRKCCGSRRKGGRKGMGMGNGMMVLPVQSGGGKGKKGKKNGKGGAGEVQVNLIVDPTAFSPPQDSSSSESDSSSGDDLPGSFPRHQSRKKRKRRKTRNIHALLALEASWRLARSWARKLAFLDALGVVIWGAVFVFVLMGKRCPSGGFEGWCNAYNVSSAAACLLCIAFGVSLFFGVKDLHASKVSPRSRT